MAVLAVWQASRRRPGPGGAVESEDQDLLGGELGHQQAAQGSRVLAAILQGRVGTMPGARKAGAEAQVGEGSDGRTEQQRIEQFKLGVASAGKDLGVDGLTKGR